MLTKRFFLALCALALLLPVGCRHRCCQKQAVSSSGCCPVPPPPPLLPPPAF
ncbi:MAG TPA: hypothetical protein VGL71_10035 [Urbifossiella sp.]